MSEVSVRVDERVRLVAAALAAGDWPLLEQNKRGSHAVHPQAKAVRRFMREYAKHPAVRSANRYLAEGISLTELFTVTVRCEWPSFTSRAPLPERLREWPAQLAALEMQTNLLKHFWPDQEDFWAEAVADLQRIFRGSTLSNFLEQLLRGPLATGLVIVPNLIYPALETVAVASEESCYLLIPPPKAVGESPPWPYRDEEEGVLATACYHLLSLVLAEPLAALPPERGSCLLHAATALFLERAVDETAAHFYLLRRQQEGRLGGVPDTLAALRLFLNGDEQASSLELLLARLTV